MSRPLLKEVRWPLGPAGLPDFFFGAPAAFRARRFSFGTRRTQDVLQEQLKSPVHIEHDAQAMALGEKWFGAARKTSHALCLNIGWGLGLGIILEGRLLYGRDGYAGEFGHIEAVPDGKLCYCGRRGCLETVASGRAIAEMARERLTLAQWPAKLGAAAIQPHQAYQMWFLWVLFLCYLLVALLYRPLGRLGALWSMAIASLAIFLFRKLIMVSLEIPFLLPSPISLLIQIGAGLLLALFNVNLAALLPAYKISRQDPAIAMRE